MMQKKHWWGLIGLFFIGIAVILGIGFYHYTNTNSHSKTLLTTNQTPKIWVLSDTHFIADSLHDNGQKFKYMEATAASKDLKYGTVLLKSLVQKALKERPAAVIITGDVTFNGAKKSATQLAKIFKPLTDNQINFLVIPGNHDIYDGWARSFKGKHEYKTEQISPEDWHHIFKSSYENATSVDPASLSYTVQLNDQYQLLLLDTNKYSVGPATTAPYTSGTIRPATIKWLEQQLKEGQKKGLRTISFTHHNLYQHSRRGKFGYVIENTATVQRIFSKYDVKLNFAGHIHAQDITKDSTGRCPTIEVLNGSYAVAPNSYGELKLTPGKLDYQKKMMDISPFLSSQEQINTDLSHHKAYAKKLFFDDTKAIIYERLYAQAKNQPKLLDAAAQSFAQLNWYFFTGTDNLSAQQVEEFEQTTGFKALVKYGAVSANYAQTALQDNNMDDNSLTIEY